MSVLSVEGEAQSFLCCPLQGMEESQEKEHHQEQLLLELESAAGDTTPLSMPSLADEESGSSPEDAAAAVDKPLMEVFDLQESSSDTGSPEMEQEKLFIKLKEVRILFWC